jgi:hypothetical protein
MSLADLDGHGGLDWGYNAHGVMLWSVALPDGELHVVREYSFRQMTAEAVGAQIHRVTKDLGMRRLVSIAADPAIWQKTGAGRGESIAETLLRLRLPLRKADNDRKLGWLRTHEYFRAKPDGSGPWLTIDPSCTGLIRTIPMMIQDSHDPDDMDTTGQDHWCDALRYLLMSRASPTRLDKAPEPYPVGSWGHATAWHDAQSVTDAVLG